MFDKLDESIEDNDRSLYLKIISTDKNKDVPKKRNKNNDQIKSKN